MIVRWLPIRLGQLAPTDLPQCRLVSNARSAGLSLSLAFLPPSLSVCLSGGFGMFGVSLSPPGFEPSSMTQKRCVVPTVLRRDAFCSLALTCSALYPCIRSLSVSPSLSLCVSLSVSLSLPLLAPLLLPLLTPPRDFSCASAASYTPLIAVPCQAYRRSHGGVFSSV